MSAIFTGQTPGGPRNDGQPRVGCKITIGAAPVIISALGRWVLPGNTQSHLIALADGTTQADIVTVTVATSGAPAGDYVYGTLASPITLAAGALYFIVSEELHGDYWCDTNPVSLSSVIASVVSCYGSAGSYGTAYGGQSYVPVNALIAPPVTSKPARGSLSGGLQLLNGGMQ